MGGVLRYHEISGYRAAIFRRTSQQITGQGGLWDEANGLFPDAGGTPRGSPHLDFRFPFGAAVTFEHLQHEKNKYDHQGKQYCYIGFDEVTHFTLTQFFYLLGRNRSTCGVKPYIRATCNPDPNSWVRQWVDWWIDPATGLPIEERSGVIRYLVVIDDQPVFADTRQQLLDRFPGEYAPEDILSITFIHATLDDNPALLEKDPGYRGRLKAQPRIERERLEKGNWNAIEGAIIDGAWLRRYTIASATYRGNLLGEPFAVPIPSCRRFATIDTAGTSKERAAEQRGDPPSYSVCAVWDYWHARDILFLVHVWRARVDWNALKATVPGILSKHNVKRVVIENAHYGPVLAQELRGIQTELAPSVLPGMDDSSRGAKLERAIASGLLSRAEDGLLWIPDDGQSPWVRAYFLELSTWTGLPKETADQIDVSSYASWWTGKTSSRWGGVIR